MRCSDCGSTTLSRLMPWYGERLCPPCLRETLEGNKTVVYRGVEMQRWEAEALARARRDRQGL